MDDTLKARYRGHLLRSSSNRPASGPTIGIPRPGCPGGAVLYRRIAVNGFLAIALGGAAYRPLQGCAFPAVAYSSGIQSRLGYSPNGGFDAAYHTTTGKSRSKTNNGLDKKSRPFRCPPLLPAPLRLTRRRRIPETDTGQYPGESPEERLRRELPSSSSYNLINQKKRTKYMSNLILPASSLVRVPPLTQSHGALGVQPCLALVTDLARTVTPAKVGPSRPPAPAPSARCSVKGCVFPASSPEGTECRYHELLRSDAVLFQSHQPSHLILLSAPFGEPEEEFDDSRQQDRKRQSAEREAFILDEPA